jgi:hypothetical protein
MNIHKKKNIVFSILLFSIIGFALRIAASHYGHNHDFEMWQKNLDLFKNGDSFYAYGKYNYTPMWINLLFFLDSITIPSFITNESLFRIKIVLFLSLIDFFIFYLLFKNYTLKIGLLFFLNPISIFITGYHNQFDNIAILLAFVAVLIYEKCKNNYQLAISLFILSISICAKHILFFFPIWLAIKEKKFIKKILIILIPYFIFFISFTKYLSNDFNHIIENVFLYKSFDNGPFWGMMAPKIIDIYINKKNLFLIAMIMLGFYFQNKSIKNTFYFYLISVVVFSSAIANQYLAIPLLAMAIFWNWKYLLYTVLCSLLFLIDGDALNIKILREFFEWDLRSTRMMYYPITLLLLLGFIETLFGKKFNSVLTKILKLFLNKIRTQFSFKL